MTFVKPEKWSEWVLKIDCIEAYSCVCKEMFIDDYNVSYRLHVLELFTQDVCKTHPHISQQVWSHFTHVSELLKNPYKKVQLYSWMYSKSHWQEKISDIVDLIAGLFN